MPPLDRLELEVSLDGEVRKFELVYLYQPALGDRPRPDRAPVVLVHGTPSTLFHWAELIYGGAGFEGLCATRDVYALEVIGHGLAPDDASPLSFQRCARFVAAALRSLKLAPVDLVGASYGGEFVWRAALDAPELVRSVVLIDSSGYARRSQDWLPEERALRTHPLARLGWLLNSHARMRGALAPHFATVPAGRVSEFFLVCENASNWRSMVELARDENGQRSDELETLDRPALLVWGERDLAYPPEIYAERFAQELPRAELVIVAGAGHYPHEERPAEVLAALERFFESLREES